MALAEHYALARSSPSGLLPQVGPWRPVGLALVLAAVAWGLVAGPQLPALLGHPEAVWGRMLSLAVPALAIAALALLLPGGWGDNEGTRIGVPAMAVAPAFFASLLNLRTPLDPTALEVADAAFWYGLTLAFLQAALTATWFWWCVHAWARRDATLAAAAVPGLLLCGLGAWIAFDAHVLAHDPATTAPWSVPLAQGKLRQVGEFGLDRLQWAMLAGACAPLAGLAAAAALRSRRPSQPAAT